jgi:acyl carrier protein
MSHPQCDVVLAKVVHAVAEVLDVPKGEIGIETRAADLEAWDSFGHVRIVLALEQLFGIELSMAEIEAADSIAGLTSVVDAAQSRAKGGAIQ